MKNTGRDDDPEKFPVIMLSVIPLQLVQGFSQNVIMAVKAIFITGVLGYSENSAVMLSHIFISFEPLSHVSGAVLADSVFGKWKVIVAGMILMRIPDVFFIWCTFPNSQNRILFITAVSLATLLNIHLPTLHAFFSEQFQMPEQENLLKRYYNILYWGRNAVSVVGAFAGSRLANISCLGQPTCYLAPFAVWVGTETVVAAITIGLGPFFIKKPPASSVILHFLECVGRALYNKYRYGRSDPKDRWIDHADDEFTDDFRDDVLIMVNMSYFFALSILYWSLYDQMFTRFIYQGAKLDQYITSDFRVYPGDMTMINPILVIILLPLLEYIVYPICNKFNFLTNDLQKVGLSEYLIATGFVAAAILEWQITINIVSEPQSGLGHLIIFNSIGNDIIVSGELLAQRKIGPHSSYVYQNIPVTGSKSSVISVKQIDENWPKEYPVTLQEKQGVAYIVSKNDFDRIAGYEKYASSADGPWIRCVCMADHCSTLSIKTEKGRQVTELKCQPPDKVENYQNIRGGNYYAYSGKRKANMEMMRMEEMKHYTVILLNESTTDALFLPSDPHSLLNYCWIIPQVFILTLGETMHAIPWRLFIYTQSPPSMRSVVFAFDLLSRSLGDLLVAIIAASSFLNHFHEFMMYAILMYVVSILFTILAIKYKSHESRE